MFWRCLGHVWAVSPSCFSGVLVVFCSVMYVFGVASLMSGQCLDQEI